MRASGSEHPLLDDVLIKVGDFIPYDLAYVCQIHDNSLKPIASRDSSEPLTHIDRSVPIDDQFIDLLRQSERPLVTETSGEFPVLRELARSSHEINSWIAAPFSGLEAGLGFLALGSRQQHMYGAEAIKLIAPYAQLAGLAVENSQLRGQTQALQERVEQQANEIQQLLDVIPNGVLLLDKEQRIVGANGAGRGYLAQLTDVQVGQKLRRLGSQPIEVLVDAKRRGVNWHELSALESKRVFEASVQAIGPKPENDSWLVLVRNVTAERKREGYLRAQERLSTVGRLAAGIAHDFNNIMAIISLYTQLVMRASGLSDGDQQRLRIIARQAQQASDLIRQILDFSRQSVVEKKPMDLLPFLRDAVRALRQSLPETIQLQTKFDDDEFLCTGDSNRLLLALNNLVANSVEAMPDGGRITFSLRNLKLASGEPFPLPDMTSGDWICITVSDTGSGMPEEMLSRIFEPFYSTKRSGESAGVGLGLAQVYGIVKLHDGFIDVDSHVGKGTVFTIYLPAFTPSIHEPPGATDEANYLGDGEKILVVEDDAATREALAEYLSGLNYVVLTSTNGQDALELCQKEGDVQLILTDMVMPVMDGATLFTELRKAREDVKMIVITGYPLDATMVALLEQEAVSFIEKPLRVVEVARVIKDTLA